MTMTVGPRHARSARSSGRDLGSVVGHNRKCVVVHCDITAAVVGNIVQYKVQHSIA